MREQKFNVLEKECSLNTLSVKSVEQPLCVAVDGKEIISSSPVICIYIKVDTYMYGPSSKVNATVPGTLHWLIVTPYGTLPSRGRPPVGGPVGPGGEGPPVQLPYAD